ncbi:MAG: GNAT family N-acetyltransferase [Ginsengibacter sp.]
MSKISKATFSDIEELNTLINSAYRGDSAKKGWTHEADILTGIRIDSEELEKIIRKESSAILKYSTDKRIDACVFLDHQDQELYLGMLTVSPTKQGMGIGKKLMHAAEIYARTLQCNKIKMTVISIRHELIAWYQRHGYCDAGERIPFQEWGKFGIPSIPLDFIVMKKDIV